MMRAVPYPYGTGSETRCAATSFAFRTVIVRVSSLALPTKGTAHDDPHRDVPLPARLLPTDQDGASLRQVAVGRHEHLHVFVGAVKHFPPDALGYPGDIFRPAGLSRQTRDVSHEFFSLKPFE
jgi:hypothetical protein